MKYIFTILLGCLMYSAQGQTTNDFFYKDHDATFLPAKGPGYAKYAGWPPESFVYAIDSLYWIVHDLSHRLDSLTHAFQTMHDSLIEMEKRPFFQLGPNLTPGGIEIDPGFWHTVTDSTLKLWREHGIPLHTLSTYTTLDSTISAPKKKRRKG